MVQSVTLSQHQMNGMNSTIAGVLREKLEAGKKDNLTAGDLAKQLIEIVTAVATLSNRDLEGQKPHIQSAVEGLKVDFDHVRALLHRSVRGFPEYPRANIDEAAVKMALSYEHANDGATVTGYGDILKEAAKKVRDRMVDLVAKVLYPDSQNKEETLKQHMNDDSRRLDALHSYFQEILSNGHFGYDL